MFKSIYFIIMFLLVYVLPRFRYLPNINPGVLELLDQVIIFREDRTSICGVYYWKRCILVISLRDCLWEVGIFSSIWRVKITKSFIAVKLRDISLFNIILFRRIFGFRIRSTMIWEWCCLFRGRTVVRKLQFPKTEKRLKVGIVHS